MKSMSSAAISRCPLKCPNVKSWQDQNAKRTGWRESGGSAVRKRPTGLSEPRVVKRYQ